MKKKETKEKIKKIVKKSSKKTTKKVVKKPIKKQTKKKTKKAVDDIHDLHKVFRRKKIICHTCKNRTHCEDAITKRYPYVCMIYVADESLEK
jgi:hypothetical protein